MPVDDYQQQQAQELQQEQEQDETFSLLEAIWAKLQANGRRIHSYQAMQQQQQQDLSKLCLAGYVLLLPRLPYSFQPRSLALILRPPHHRFDPLYNVKGQNPCQVARILADRCLSGPQGPQFYPLYPLAVDQDQDHYVPPTGAQQSPCVCSSELQRVLLASSHN